MKVRRFFDGKGDELDPDGKADRGEAPCELEETGYATRIVVCTGESGIGVVVRPNDKLRPGFGPAPRDHVEVLVCRACSKGRVFRQVRFELYREIRVTDVELLLNIGGNAAEARRVLGVARPKVVN